MKKIPHPTVGRFWGYIGILIALSVSLAGNVTAAYLHDKEPTWVDLGFAGIPPLVAFLSVEIVNHNPWEGTRWGGTVKWVLLAVVAPAAAIVSFIHLTTVVITGRVHDLTPEGVLNWVTAVLTALLIDGLMFGGTAALLLPPKPEPVLITGVIESVPDWRAEMALQFAEREATLQRTVDALREEIASAPKGPARKTRPKAPVVAGSLAPQVTLEEKDRKRWPPREHPLWKDWLAARGGEKAWDAEEMVLQTKQHMGREITLPAARMVLVRFEKELATS